MSQRTPFDSNDLVIIDFFTLPEWLESVELTPGEELEHQYAEAFSKHLIANGYTEQAASAVVANHMRRPRPNIIGILILTLGLASVVICLAILTYVVLNLHRLP